MKKLGSLFFLLLITFLFGNHALAEEETEGTIDITAKFTAQSCQLSFKDTELDFGTHNSRTLPTSITTAEEHASNSRYTVVNITNCPISKTVRVSFSSTQVFGNIYIKNAEDANGTYAKNVVFRPYFYSLKPDAKEDEEVFKDGMRVGYWNSTYISGGSISVQPDKTTGKGYVFVDIDMIGYGGGIPTAGLVEASMTATLIVP